MEHYVVSVSHPMSVHPMSMAGALCPLSIQKYFPTLNHSDILRIHLCVLCCYCIYFCICYCSSDIMLHCLNSVKYRLIFCFWASLKRFYKFCRWCKYFSHLEWSRITVVGLPICLSVCLFKNVNLACNF